MATGGRVRAPFGIVANKSQCSQMHCQGGAEGGRGTEINWANYVPRKALSPSVIKTKHTFAIGTVILLVRVY